VRENGHAIDRDELLGECRTGARAASGAGHERKEAGGRKRIVGHGVSRGAGRKHKGSAADDPAPTALNPAL
jgi:hypothetical protein